MNRLREQGVTLNQHYVQRWCAPTRAALMTGRFPYNVGMNQYNHGVQEERSSVRLPGGFPTSTHSNATERTHARSRTHAHARTRAD
jgi:arylsulfatase A-like enzyme